MEIKSKDDFNKLKKEKLVILKFGADWCGPCKVLQPVFNDLSTDDCFKNILFASTNIDHYPELAVQFNISSVPTMIILEDGKESSRKEGAMGKTALKNWLKMERK